VVLMSGLNSKVADRLYYESGRLKIEINFVNGKKDGLATLYNEDGAVQRTEMYRNGELVK
jgi:antitoxin component YwqK of YwqJK toxin-antitoxin module